MDLNNLFSFKCNKCSATFTTKWSLNRHVQHMHDNYKYTCNICFSQFSRLYTLNHHIKLGKCKLDLGKNPIVQVTPLGPVSLPQISGHEKVSEWLEPTNPAKKSRMDTGVATPSTSTGVRGSQPPITTKPLRTAKAQNRAMAAVAMNPTDSSWNRRDVFNPGLPLFHANQQVSRFGSQVPETNPPSHCPPTEGVEVQGPSHQREPDSPHASHSCTTVAAHPPTGNTSSSDLSIWAERLMANLGEPEGPDRTPGSSASPASTNDIIKDLLLSDDSSSLPEVLCKTAPDKESSPSASGTTISESPSDEYRALPGTGANSLTGPGDQPTTLSQAVLAIGCDLEKLVALNNKVHPQNQLEFLHEIHQRFHNFMAPYLLYHK